MNSIQPVALNQASDFTALTAEIQHVNNNFSVDGFMKIAHQAVVLTKMGLYSEIIQFLENLLDLENLPIIHGLLGMLKFQVAGSQSALKHFDFVARAFPEPPDFWQDFISKLKPSPLIRLAVEIRKINSNFNGDEFYSLVSRVIKLSEIGLNTEIEQLLQNLLIEEDLQIVHGLLTALRFQQFNRKSAKEHYVLVEQAFPQPGDFWKNFIGALIMLDMKRALSTQ